MTDRLPATRPWIVLVGGFLGAGKTTLLLAAARELERRGMRSAVILNDQGDALVDTEYATLHNLPNSEVAGGCFCCRYSELTSVLEKLRAQSPDVIFAEPVGSCTDISATILHPLQELIEFYRVAPFTVLVDPERGKSLVSESADPNLRFLFQKQLEEADIVCFTKADIYPDHPDIGVSNARTLSAKTDQGVSGWLDEVLSGKLSSGSSVLNIDYEQYAQAEASLAWLNLQVTILADPPVPPAMVLGPIFDQLDTEFTASGMSIVHMKAIIRSESGFLKAAICHNGQQPDIDGALDASPARVHELLLNLRVMGKAAQVRSITERIFDSQRMQIRDLLINCFHPFPPKPERRISIGDIDA